MRRISRPLPESVSIDSFRLFSPAPWLRNASARAIRSLSERPRRSSRQITGVSSARRCASASRRPGRSAERLIGIFKNSLAPSRLKRITLEIERPVVRRDASVTDEHRSISGKRRQRYHDFQTEFADAQSHVFARIRARSRTCPENERLSDCLQVPRALAADAVIRRQSEPLAKSVSIMAPSFAIDPSGNRGSLRAERSMIASRNIWIKFRARCIREDRFFPE